MIRIFLIIVFDLFRKNLRNTNLNLIIFVNKTEATVLIIDDDAEIRYSLDRVLVGQGLQVISADSGEKGIETAKLEKPTLIFLDNRMGGISGIETLQHLRTAAPQSLVILMTAYGTTQTAIEAMKHGAFDYVLKPCLLYTSPSPRDS